MNQKSELEYVDFEIIKENWNLYELEDGALLKFKLVLVKLMPNKDKPQEYSINASNVVGVQSKKELRGDPTPLPPGGIYSEFEKKDLTFKVVKEDWSEYKTKDGKILKMKPAITTINKTKNFDNTGEPIYVVHSQIVIKPGE